MRCNWCAVLRYSCKHSVHSIAGKESFYSFHSGKITSFGFTSDLIVVLVHNAEIYDFLFGFSNKYLSSHGFSWVVTLGMA